MKAWIENNVIRDIAHSEPSEIYHPDIAKFYDTDVPADAQNGWILESNVWVAPVIVEPVVVEPIIEPQKLVEQDITNRLNAFARERDYDDIIDVCSYINSTNELWKIEAQIAISRRDAIWQAFYAGEVLPNLVWD